MSALSFVESYSGMGHYFYRDRTLGLHLYAQNDLVVSIGGQQLELSDGIVLRAAEPLADLEQRLGDLPILERNDTQEVFNDPPCTLTVHLNQGRIEFFELRLRSKGPETGDSPSSGAR